LKRLFEPDADDELWKSQKNIHHGDKTWRLYDTCGVHHVSIKDGVDIYMLVEREYPLSRGRKTKKMKCLEASFQSRRVIVQQVQGRQSQGYAGNSSKSNVTALGVNRNGGNNATAWFKKKLMRAKAQDSGQVLDEE
nr:hypothetical protein [Tanacetum cinerariifolium]